MTLASGIWRYTVIFWQSLLLSMERRGPMLTEFQESLADTGGVGDGKAARKTVSVTGFAVKSSSLGIGASG